MKAFYFLIPFLIAGACGTQSTSVVSSEKNSMETVENTQSGCPDDGTCTVIVQKNKSLKLHDGEGGEVYPEVVEGQNIVVEYTFHRPGPEGTADGNYMETLHFEIPAKAQELEKSDASLADVKMLFGKHGFRQSQTYPVRKGKLYVKKDGDVLAFTFQFNVDKTSHELSRVQVSQTIK